mmetsp:Transcript_95057/g.307665  ORF Transcript_95057/g.307665 Transcript_95057/m.307665 type:complete len:304 (+) Transcript_95057:403-1314(+)
MQRRGARPGALPRRARRRRRLECGPAIAHPRAARVRWWRGGDGSESDGPLAGAGVGARPLLLREHVCDGPPALPIHISRPKRLQVLDEEALRLRLRLRGLRCDRFLRRRLRRRRNGPRRRRLLRRLCRRGLRHDRHHLCRLWRLRRLRRLLSITIGVDHGDIDHGLQKRSTGSRRFCRGSAAKAAVFVHQVVQKIKTQVEWSECGLQTQVEGAQKSLQCCLLPESVLGIGCESLVTSSRRRLRQRLCDVAGRRKLTENQRCFRTLAQRLPWWCCAWTLQTLFRRLVLLNVSDLDDCTGAPNRR